MKCNEEVIKQQEIDEQHENYEAWHNFWFHNCIIYENNI